MKKFKHVIYLFSVGIAILFLQSCAAYNYYGLQPITVPDILQMTKDGVPSKNIIKEIRKSHTVYWLKADQLAKLRGEGVPDSVINYMETTKLNAVRQNQRIEDSYYGWPGWGGYWYGPGFGWPYSYWGFGFGPTIIFENHHFYGGGVYRGGGGSRGGGGRSR